MKWEDELSLLEQKELARFYEDVIAESRRNSGLSEEEAVKLAVEETRAARGL